MYRRGGLAELQLELERDEVDVFLDEGLRSLKVYTSRKGMFGTRTPLP